MRFEFASAGRVVFGPGVISELPGLAIAYGNRALVVTGKNKIRHAGIVADLEARGFTCALFGVPGEPTVQLIREGAELARSMRCSVVIAVGGGSAIDAGKAIAAIAANRGDVLDYLEVVGNSMPMPETPLPFLAVPTTAGTGSEVTRNAVLGSPEHGIKASLRSQSMLARIALVDPDLTITLPREVTAATGLDALTQLIEPYVSSRANPLTDTFCIDGMKLVARNLRRVWEDGRDTAARAAMSYASLLSGLALSNAGLGVVHGFASAIGGIFEAPHGNICAAMLPHCMTMNIRLMKDTSRYETVARTLTGDSHATAMDGVSWVRSLVKGLGIPPLAKYGVTPERYSEIAATAKRAGSTKANPIALSEDDLLQVLEGLH